MWKHVLSRINSQKLKDSAVLYSPSGWWKVWWHFVVRETFQELQSKIEAAAFSLTTEVDEDLFCFSFQCWYWIFSIMSHSQDGRKGNICSTYIHPHTDICLLICISLYTHTQKKWHPLSSEPPIPHPKFQFASFLSRRSTCGICFKMTRNKRDLPPEVWDPKLIWKERDLRPF